MYNLCGNAHFSVLLWGDLEDKGWVRYIFYGLRGIRLRETGDFVTFCDTFWARGESALARYGRRVSVSESEMVKMGKN